MPYLNCNADKCKHNHEHKCTRNTIKVGDCFKNGSRQVECKDFKEGYSVMDNEFARDIISNTISLDQVHVDCASKDCIYNEDNDCTVSKVEIKKPTTNQCCVDAECSTYKKR